MNQRWPCLILLLAVLAACAPTPITPAPDLPSPTPTPTPTAVPPSPTPPPTPQSEIVILLPELPDTLNPLYARSWSARAAQHLYLGGLWRLDDRLDPVADIALTVPALDNGGVSIDGHTLTIHLRSDAAWSDGQPITADDVIFTYEMARAESNTVPTRFPYDSAVRSVVALDAQTVQITFVEPFAPWAATVFPFILPRHVLEPVYAQEGTLDGAAWNRAPTVGSGPYVYAGEDSGDLLFDANPFYWQGRPTTDRVRLRAHTDPAARWAAITAGSADMAAFLWPEPLPNLLPPDNVRLLTSPSGYVETLYFNLDPRYGHVALQDARVRAALAQALDRQALCQALSASRAQPALSLLSGTVFEDPATASLSASLVEANRQLDDAGWRDSDGDGIRDREGTPLTLRYAAPPREGGPELLAAMLQAVGVGIVTVQEQQPWENPAAWDLAQWAEQPAGYPDPDDPRWLCVEARPGGHNPAGVCSEELDGLLIAQAHTVDPDERAALLFQVQALARSQTLWVPLCRWEDIWAIRADLEGPQPWRGAPLWNIGTWQP